jgi:tetratricopeptide (TPR) repeat protein
VKTNGETLTPEVNPVLEAYLNGEYQQGLDAYRTLEQPNAEASAWAGQCWFNLNRNVEALEAFGLARSAGFEDAGVFAATVMRFSSGTEAATTTLNGVDQTKLTPFGRAAFAREFGLLAVAANQNRIAVKHLETAWQLAASDPIGQRLLHRFSQSLAFALIESGRDVNALPYLGRALESSPTNHRGSLLLLRAASRAYTGAVAEARQDLATVAELEGTLTPIAFHRYVQGMVARVQGLTQEAAEHFLESAAQAKLAGEAETECFAELALSALLVGEGTVPIAQAHLSRAQGLAESVAQHALLGLRHGALLARQHDVEAIEVLEASLKVFEDLNLERDAGIAHLHLAEACLRIDQEYDALQHLARAINARHALGNGAMFAVELRGLPAVFELLSGQPRTSGLQPLLDDWRALELNAPGQVGLVTLGGYGLSLNGQPIKIESGTARTVELLAFLLDSGEASVENIITNVFDQVPVANARNSIHVIRGSIARTIPGLVIPHLKDKRKYTVSHAGLRLNWDALEVKRALEIGGEIGMRRALALYTGSFLPNSQSEWVEIFRSELEFSVANLGLETVEDLYALERFEACVDLALRLLEVNVLNIGVSVMLVKATAQLKGAFAAQEALDHVLKSFERGLGVVPELLRDLRLQPGLDLN